MNITIKETTALVRALCCLHNYLIDEKPLPSTMKDRTSILSWGGRALHEGNENNIEELLHHGEHNDDTSRNERNNHTRRQFNIHQINPRKD